jgi:Cytochrome B6-F complex subunit VI (PetL)
MEIPKMGIVFFVLYLGGFFALAVGLLFGLRAIKLI